jgi:ketosteroid isomerase-like protein
MPHTRRLVEDLARWWKANDVDRTLAVMADDIVYVLHGSTPIERSGKPAFGALLRHMSLQWDYEQYESTVMGVTEGADSDVVRVKTDFAYRHRASGRLLSGSKRFKLTVRDGVVVRIDEFQDEEMVRAFMRLVTLEVDEGVGDE